MFERDVWCQLFLLQRIVDVEPEDTFSHHHARRIDGWFQTGERYLPIERHVAQVGPPLGDDQLERRLGFDAKDVTRIRLAGDVDKLFKFVRSMILMKG